MWAPLPPEPQPVGWWVQLERQQAVKWAEGLVAERALADRIGRLRARANMVEARVAAASVWHYKPKPLPDGWVVGWSETEGCYVRQPGSLGA